MTRKIPVAVALHECPGCGERHRVAPGSYCPCNPKAPYRMVALTVLASVAAVLGRRGGRVGGLATTPAKRRAARANGKLGGRPKSS